MGAQVDAAAPVVLDATGDRGGPVRAEVTLDQPERHVDARGDPAGGHEVAVVDDTRVYDICPGITQRRAPPDASSPDGRG